MPAKKKRRMKVLGDLVEGMLLTKEGCMRRAGIGANSLDVAIESGIVQPIEIAGRHYYESSEVMRWIRERGRKLNKRYRNGHHPNRLDGSTP